MAKCYSQLVFSCQLKGDGKDVEILDFLINSSVLLENCQKVDSQRYFKFINLRVYSISEPISILSL